jgi:LacI family transcriptional regulator
VPTSADVARLAGVSLSTVSHALNGTRYVTPETRQRVLSAVETIGWRPDRVARSLRRAKTDTVGVIVDDTSQPAFAAMIRGIDEEAVAAGLTLLLANSGGDRDRELSSVEAFREHRVDGLLIAQVGSSDGRLLESLRAWPAPVVRIDRLDAADFDQVGVDNVPAMRRLVGHLVERKYERVALVAGDLDTPTLAERMRGYELALDDAGLTLDSDLVLADREGPALTAVLRRLLGSATRPPAIASSSVTLTAELLRVAKELGLRIPDDVAVVAFDTFAYSDLFSPQLTSVEQPAADIGRAAMGLLLRRMAEPDVSPRTLRLDGSLVHGDSCGCPSPRPPLSIIPAAALRAANVHPTDEGEHQ